MSKESDEEKSVDPNTDMIDANTPSVYQKLQVIVRKMTSSGKGKVNSTAIQLDPKNDTAKVGLGGNLDVDVDRRHSADLIFEVLEISISYDEKFGLNLRW